MRRFTDRAGREWAFDITLATVIDVRDATGVDLSKAAEDEGKSLAAVAADPFVLLDVIYACVRKQAEERSVDQRGLAESLAGDELDAAARAFLDALTDFMSARSRIIFSEVVSRGRAISEQVQATVAKAVQSPEYWERMQAQVRELEEEILAMTAPLPDSGPSSTGPPGS